MSSYPAIRLLPGSEKRLRTGQPWLFSNEVEMSEEAKALPPGSIVRLLAPSGKVYGVGHFNPHSLIAVRVLSRNKDAVIDRKFFEFRFARALALREQMFDEPFYRLVHAEGDGLPGVVVDRHGRWLVIQINTAGMERMRADLLEALGKVVPAEGILLRGDTSGRVLEGLDGRSEVLAGEVPEEIEIRENGLPFVISPRTGQKTGWYYDQRLNRLFSRMLVRGRTVLDLYSYTGSFALNALAAGARSALLVDSSGPALERARASAALQGVADRVECVDADVFDFIAQAGAEHRRWGVVFADPPAFVKTKKQLPIGLRAYRKLARDSAALVQEGGFLAISCCSHNVSPDAFFEEVTSGIRAAGRGARLLCRAGAGPDHPIHPALPETAYLKFLAFALD
ncbi:Ribosomal RNA large subunit methyltransferase I [bacterium HR40]|nr:Ribosomal RNA large subunit methyltransferase I [bacterium HR40]